MTRGPCVRSTVWIRVDLLLPPLPPEAHQMSSRNDGVGPSTVSLQERQTAHGLCRLLQGGLGPDGEQPETLRALHPEATAHGGDEEHQDGSLQEDELQQRRPHSAGCLHGLTFDLTAQESPNFE